MISPRTFRSCIALLLIAAWPLYAQVEWVVDTRSGRSLEERSRAVSQITPPLDSLQLQAVLAYLVEPLPEAKRGNHPEYTIRNDLLETLNHPKQTVDPIVDVLIKIVLDAEENPVWRDYALQHLGVLRPRSSPEKQQTSLNVLWSLSDLPHDSLASTALISISLQNDLSEAAFLRLQQRSFAVAADPKQSLANRSPALQLASESDHPQSEELAKTILKTERSMPLRMSALAVLGQHGGTDVLPLLAEYQQEQTLPPLRSAANAAQQQILKRTQPLGN